MVTRFLACLFVIGLAADYQLCAQITATKAITVMKRASSYMSENVATHGGYVWRIGADLKSREGEIPTGEDAVWIEQPGTASMGNAYLRAYQATGDRFFLKLAMEVGQCLLQGQLVSGGWDNSIEFDPKIRKKFAYRVENRSATKLRNTTTLDDNKTQETIRFLMRLDRELDFNDQEIHEAVEYALTRLLSAQYPNGAWPQRFDGPNSAKEIEAKLRASFPESWSRSWSKADYKTYFTFNDNSIIDMIHVMYEAFEIYKDRRFRDAAHRAGEFIIAAQMPDPQPAWAQQYNFQLQPAWARKFEPPAITGGESQGVMKGLIDLYVLSGEKRFLDPVPRALAYLEKSVRNDGKLARFYELKTNRPLYFTKDYKLTYRDDDLPTHYGFVVKNQLGRIRERMEQVVNDDSKRKELSVRLIDSRIQIRNGQVPKSIERAAAKVVAELDDVGRWLELGRMKSDPERERLIVNTGTFVRNMETLSRFVAYRP